MERRLVALLCAALALPLATAAAAAPSAKYAVPLPPGAGKPTPGSGIYTQAALDNPLCVIDKERYPYGRFDGAVVGGGAVCTRPFKTGENNGGATSTGVTKDAVKVVVVLGAVPEPSSPSLNATTNQPGTDQDSIYDLWTATRPLYETWGREIDVTFYKSTGVDETAQRADAVAIKAMKPFAVYNSYNVGLPVMAAELAKAKILTYDAATTRDDFTAFAPYLWGSTDPQVSAIVASEVIGKQLVGKKAEFGGDDVKGQVRKFGLITKENDIDVPGFKEALGKYKGTVTSEATYPQGGGSTGDATIAGQFAPTIVSKMKTDGVTTMVLFTDAAMNKALMEQAAQQDWTPEWFHPGNTFADYSLFAKNMPADQREHFFGISGSSPYVVPATDPQTTTLGPAGNTLDWFWGLNKYTSTARIGNGTQWLFQGIHAAGPDLTPEDVPAGPVLDPGGRWLGQRHRDRDDGRLRAHHGSPVRPVQPGPGRLPALLDEERRGAQRHRHVGHPVGLVREGRQDGRDPAVPGRHDPDQEDQVVRRLRVGRVASRRRPTSWPPLPVRTTCEGCPSTGATSPTPSVPSNDGFVVPLPTTTPSTNNGGKPTS